MPAATPLVRRSIKPAAQNRAALEAAMNSNRDATILVLPEANHVFLRAKTGVRTEYPELTHFVSGYFDVMSGWIASRVTDPAAARSTRRKR